MNPFPAHIDIYCSHSSLAAQLELAGEMGKGSDPWDDSALINAFDHAMAKYKVMHSAAYKSNPTEEVNNKIGDNENEPFLTEAVGSNISAEDNSNNASNNAVETSVPCDNNIAATEVKENHFSAYVHGSEPPQHSSGFPLIDEKVDSFSNQQGTEYNQLLQQYYELEEQRQKILQQLQQASYWNHQTPVQCSTCPQPQMSAYDISEHGLPTPCCLSSCYCLAAPSVSYGCCAPWNAYSAAQSCPHPGSGCPVKNGMCAVDPIKQSTQADDYVVKTGMLVAEKAISSMRTTSKACDEKGIGKEKEEGPHVCEGGGDGSIASDPNLAVVLSTWYAAGFHTARYLAEQSKRKVNQ